jgi:hypothetical protein
VSRKAVTPRAAWEKRVRRSAAGVPEAAEERQHHEHDDQYEQPCRHELTSRADSSRARAGQNVE